MIRCHPTVLASLQHASTWGAISVPLWTFGGVLDKPYSIMLYGAATACSVLAIILAPPRDDHHDQPEDH